METSPGMCIHAEMGYVLFHCPFRRWTEKLREKEEGGGGEEVLKSN